MKRSGTVRDIRTGRAIGKTQSLTETFTLHVRALIEQEQEFYLVYGRCRHRDMRELIDQLQALEGFPVVYDPKMPSDIIYIFGGQPEELGFAV